MTRFNYVHFLGLALICLLLDSSVSIVHAQTTGFTYQGRLSDGGTPATGLYDLQFKLYNALTGGVQQGATLERDDVQVIGGTFSVTLDFGAASFSGADRWLEVGVRAGASTGSFTALSPLQAITPTPYAIRSQSAATADGLSTVCVNCVTGSQLASLPSLNLDTAGVLKINNSTFLHNYGTDNAFLGTGAGNFTMTGSAITAVGFNALHNNTTGNANSAIGFQALSSNTTGYSNTASGQGALQSNTGGVNNVANGSSALFVNTTGSNNTANGFQALFGNTTGSSNTALGYNADVSSPGLTNATAIGANALVSASNALVLGDTSVKVGIGVSAPTQKLDVNGTVKATAFVGDGALLTNVPAGPVTSASITDGTIVDADINASASIAPAKIAGTAATLGGNTFTATQTISTGNLSLASTTNSSSGVLTLGGNRFLHNFGTDNTFLGKSAGNFSVTGVENTAVGTGALSSNTTSSYNVAIGAYSLLNSTSGNNTASGAYTLYLNTTGTQNTASGAAALVTNTTGSNNTASGFQSLYLNKEGGSNTASGKGSLQSNTTGSNNTASGASTLFSNSTGSNNTGLGRGADVSSGNLNNATAIGANAIVNASNKIRLGDSNVTVIEGQVAYTFTSDRTKKENFQSVDAEDVLKKLSNLDVSSWNYIGHDGQEFRHYGPMAQDFFAAFGNDGIGTIGTPTTINSGDQAGILMLAVKALEKRTDDLQHENELLRIQNAQYGRSIQVLTSTIEELAARMGMTVGAGNQ